MEWNLECTYPILTPCHMSPCLKESDMIKIKNQSVIKFDDCQENNYLVQAISNQ